MTDLVDRFIHRYGRLPTERDPDYLEMLRMSKYRILAVPDLQPGKCANCGSSKDDGRKYVDFGLDVSWYGIVFLCGLCLKDIAQNMGLFDDLRKQLDAVLDVHTSVGELQQKGVQLYHEVTNAFKEFQDYYADLHSIGNDSGADPSAVLDNNTPTDGSAEQVTTETKSRTSKPTSSSGRENLPSLTKLLGDDSG